MEQLIYPDWPAPRSVRAASALRSVTPDQAWRSLGIPGEPRWLSQIHGAGVVCADDDWTAARADGCVSFSSHRPCVLRTADCLPILLCDDAGTRVGAAHAGWRGLASGVIESTVAALCRGVAGATEPERLMAWIGPGIGSSAYQVRADVYRAITTATPDAARFFLLQDSEHWLLDMASLARHKLECLRLSRIYGGRWCTFSDPGRFHSYRRDGDSGRHASFIWLTAG